MQKNQFDIVINGGGMVGAALACGLSRHQFRVAVIDQQIPAPFDPLSLPDMRISAISRASVNLLEELGIWTEIHARRSAPYRQLETWEWDCATTSFHADLLGLPELGFMVENSLLQRVLWERMQALEITLFMPDKLATMTRSAGGWQIVLGSGKTVNAHLLVGADGAGSQVRQQAMIGTQGWDYTQACMLISVACDQPAGDSTWQQFTPQGPRALLPLWDHYASLVWYDSPARIHQLRSLSMSQLTEQITEHFPARLGKVTALQAGSFPLTRRHAECYIQPGLALVGDAAHTINPLAGQGVNLGYRDIDVLIDVLVEGRRQTEEWWALPVLQRYQRKRYPDNLLMQTGIDLFYVTFSNHNSLLTVVRNLGLMSAQRGVWLKRKALSYALGL